MEEGKIERKQNRTKAKIKIQIRLIGILSVFLIALGLFLTIRGLIIQKNLGHILTEIQPACLSYGQYIQADITEFLGSYSTFPGEQDKFYPYCMEEFPSGRLTYLVAFPPENNFYFSLYVPFSYADEAQAFFYGKSGVSYSVTGKIVRLRRPLPYDFFAEYVRLTDKQEIHALASPDFAIILVDLEREKRVLPSGICTLFAGLLLLIILKPISITLHKEQ